MKKTTIIKLVFYRYPYDVNTGAVDYDHIIYTEFRGTDAETINKTVQAARENNNVAMYTPLKFASLEMENA